jgi:hypothetical protein
MTQKPRGLGLLVGLVLAGGPAVDRAAMAADPSKAVCLSASAEWADLREAHNLRAARDQLFLCAAASCPTDIREECSRHIPELSAAIPSIVFAAKDSSGNDVVAVTVSMDGKPLLTKLDGNSVTLDPGEHTFRFDAPGQPSVGKTFVIQEGEKDRRERIDFKTGAPAPPPSPTPVQNGPAPQPLGPAQKPSTGDTAPSSEGATGSGLGGQKVLGLVAGGVGVAGVAVGAVFGVVANSKWQSAKSDCGAGCGPSSPAQAEKSDATSAATISTIGFIAGGALVATGMAVFFTAPSGSATETTRLRLTPSLGPGLAAMTVAGRF